MSEPNFIAAAKRLVDLRQHNKACNMAEYENNQKEIANAVTDPTPAAEADDAWWEGLGWGSV